MKKITNAIIILGYNSQSFLKDCITSILRQSQPSDIFFVDNASSDSSVEFVKEQFPQVRIIEHSSNDGYAKAYNAAITRCFHEGYKTCILINPDITLHKDCVRELIATASAHPRCGLVQPCILLKNTNNINTLGNSIHFLGFGYCPVIGSPFKPLKRDTSIPSASGAALLISSTYFKTVGGFNNQFFMYGEDQDLSWRGLLQGYTHYVSAKGLAHHDYSFSRNKDKWYHSEKNRIMMILQNYTLITLLCILPVFILTELCMLFFHLYNHTFIEKVRSYVYIVSHYSRIKQTRRSIQHTRQVPDKTVMSRFDSNLNSPLFRNPLLTYVLNPLYRICHAIICDILYL